MPAIDVSQVKWDSPTIDPNAVTWDEPQGAAKNIATGALRGFNDVVGTLGSLLSKVTPDLPQYQKQRQQFDDFNKQLDTAAGDSLAYRGAKLAGHIGATAPAGGVVAAPLKAVSEAGYGASILGPLADAIATGGLRAGGAAGLGGLAARTAGGAINGAASAGLVDPNSMGAGATIGALLPNAIGATGLAFQKAFSSLRGGATSRSPEALAALRQAQEAGYVIPPTQVIPSLFNRALEGLAGKLTTAQEAASRNQTVTNDLAAAALGLPKGTTLTPELLDQLRASAGRAYADVSKVGTLDATRAALPSGVKVTESNSPLLFGKQQSVDTGDLVNAWKQFNADATAYFRSYARTADPETLTKARAAAAAAKQVDEFLSNALEQGGNSGMLEALKAARKQIAKSYSVEGATNLATGTVDARKLAAQLQKGKPLSGELKQIAEFAGRFPQAAKPIEQMGSLPGISPLDWAAAGGIATGSGNPAGLLSVLARPMARATALSPRIQSGLLGPAPIRSSGLLGEPDLFPLLAAKSAPLLGTGQ